MLTVSDLCDRFEVADTGFITFQHVYFNVLILPLFTGWYHSGRMKQMFSHWWISYGNFLDIIRYQYRVLITFWSRRIGFKSRRLGNRVPFPPSSVSWKGWKIPEVACFLAGCRHLTRTLFNKWFIIVLSSRVLPLVTSWIQFVFC